MNEETKVETMEQLKEKLAHIDEYYDDLKSGLSQYLAREVALRLTVQCHLSRNGILNIADCMAVEAHEYMTEAYWQFGDARVDYHERNAVYSVALNKTRLESVAASGMKLAHKIQHYQFKFRIPVVEIETRNDYKKGAMLDSDFRVLRAEWEAQRERGNDE